MQPSAKTELVSQQLQQGKPSCANPVAIPFPTNPANTTRTFGSCRGPSVSNTPATIGSLLNSKSKKFKSLLTRQMSNPESILSRGSATFWTRSGEAGSQGSSQCSTAAPTLSASAAKSSSRISEASFLLDSPSRVKAKYSPAGVGRLFKRQFLLCMLLATAVLAQSVSQVAALDFFDDDCPDNGMRKPPRFGKRSHGGQFSLEQSEQLGVDPATWPSPDSFPSSRVRRAGSDCFRAPFRRRMLRGASSKAINSGLIKRYLASIKSRRDVSPPIAAIELTFPSAKSFGPVVEAMSSSISSASNNEDNQEEQQKLAPEAPAMSILSAKDSAVIARLQSQYPKMFRDSVVKRMLDNFPEDS